MAGDSQALLDVHLLSFEGPDDSSRAGALARPIAGLARALAHHGFDTHLWLVGDPTVLSEESGRHLTPHRWCQWISRYHPAGGYDGEDAKAQDDAASLPLYLLERFLKPRLRIRGARAAVLAEEWHTLPAVLRLDWLLRREGLRDRVAIWWNASKTFGFERIDWARLAQAATITTVSRSLRYQIWEHGVDPVVIPNGLPPETFAATDCDALAAFRQLTRDRVVLVKVAGWDPDQRWLLAMDTVRELKREGLRPLLVAGGGLEAHGDELRRHAVRCGLRVADHWCEAVDARSALETVRAAHEVDVVHLRTPLEAEPRRLLLEAASAVLANSGHEPFGLVGLETMAASGVACIGATGEDYVVAGWNAVVLQTQDPRELVTELGRLRADRAVERALRRRGRSTAGRYAWPAVVEEHVLPRLRASTDRRRRLTKRGQHLPRSKAQLLC